MMQFNVNGQYLELPADFSIQFQKKNILFSFDNIECERSTSFEIPATPTNDRIFELSRQVQNTGSGMRKRYDAELQGSGVTKRGYLYVSSAEKSAYNAVFVTSELLGLQAIQNAGKLADFLRLTDTTSYSVNGYSPAVGESSIWTGVNYKKPTGALIRPSIRLGQLYDAIFSTLGVTHSQIPAEAASIRIIPSEINSIKKESVTLTENSGVMVTDGTYPVCLYVSNSLPGDVISYSEARVARRENNGATTFTGTARVFYAKQNIVITFPDDWNDDLFIGRFLSSYTQNEEYLLEIFEFLGDRSFDRNKKITGESLRGRTVEIEQGGEFLIISKDDYIYTQVGGWLTEGWLFAGVDGVDCAVEIEGGEITPGAYVRLQDNLPEITAVDLLKYIAAFSGKMLNYDDANGITFDNLDFETWKIKEIKDILTFENITRGFSDYAQRNVLRFADKIGIAYTIENVNLTEEKELQNIPFTQGGGVADAIYIDDQTEGDVVGTNGGGDYLARFELIKNAGLQTLCDASTAVTIKSRMSLLEFESITPKTLLYYDGVRYVWTEAQWSKDVATFKLSKT